MAGEQVPDHVVVEAEAQDQLVARGNFHQLSRRQLVDNAGHFFRHAKPIQGLGAIGADHVLCQHQVGEVDFAHFLQQLLVDDGGVAHYCLLIRI